LLAGVRVLSTGHTLPAMYCIPALRDLGADVTLVDAPQTEAVAVRYASLAGLLPTRSLLAGTSRCQINLWDPAAAMRTCGWRRRPTSSSKDFGRGPAPGWVSGTTG